MYVCIVGILARSRSDGSWGGGMEWRGRMEWAFNRAEWRHANSIHERAFSIAVTRTRGIWPTWRSILRARMIGNLHRFSWFLSREAPRASRPPGPDAPKLISGWDYRELAKGGGIAGGRVLNSTQLNYRYILASTCYNIVNYLCILCVSYIQCYIIYTRKLQNK